MLGRPHYDQPALSIENIALFSNILMAKIFKERRDIVKIWNKKEI